MKKFKDQTGRLVGLKGKCQMKLVPESTKTLTISVRLPFSTMAKIGAVSMITGQSRNSIVADAVLFCLEDPDYLDGYQDGLCKAMEKVVAAALKSAQSHQVERQ